MKDVVCVTGSSGGIGQALLAQLIDRYQVKALFTSGGYWLIGEGRPLGTGSMPAVVVLTVLVGFFGIASAVMAPSMMADITALDERATGRRRDGTFFGVHSFTQQMSSGIAVLIAGALVDLFAGLVAGQAEQTPVTVERLAMIASLLPAVLLAAAGLILLRYDPASDSRPAAPDLAPADVRAGLTPTLPHEQVPGQVPDRAR